MYRRPRERRNSYILAVLAVLAVLWGAASACAAPLTGRTATGTIQPAACPNAALRPTRSDLPAVVAATACLLDRVRGAHHLVGLHTNRALQDVAAGHSWEMVLGDYFGDDSRTGLTPIQRIAASPYAAGARSARAAQNIGWATRMLATPASMVQAWMNSPPHRAIILTRAFHDVGIGVVPAAPATLSGGQPGATYTVDFGVRR